MPQHLFVYGTLHPDRAPTEIAPAVSHLREIGPATLRGTRYDLGEYPGVVLYPNRSDIVHGTIFELPEDPSVLAAVLKMLDCYEDYRPADPNASLFLRVAHPVTQPDGSALNCWVYVYNREPPHPRDRF